MRDIRTDTEAIPFWERFVTFIRVSLPDGVTTSCVSKTDKREALKTAARDMPRAEATYLVAWTGEWTTDIFKVTFTDIERWTKQL